MAAVTQLGYLGLSVSDVDEWERFAADIRCSSTLSFFTATLGTIRWPLPHCHRRPSGCTTLCSR